MKIADFFDTEFKEFSNLDNVRSIPSLIDGFKDSQRKAIYGMMSRPLKEVKIAQAAGEVALNTHYNHGENSMGNTLVGLAQNYPGSNNVNLLEPIGQFGSILTNESSSHRYIFTKVSENLRKYIRKEDDIVLEHKTEDGDKVEPKVFYPVIPLWIVNGSNGIGTGHSCKILPRNPESIKRILSNWAKGSEPKSLEKLLMPYYEGWKGSVIKVDENSFILEGVIEKINTSTVKITEVPPNMGIDKVKANLVKLLEENKIRDFDNNSSEEGFEIIVKMPRDVAKKTTKQLLNLFKLTTRVTENVTMWSSTGELTKYENVEEALREFLQFKLSKVEERRIKQIELLEEQSDFLNQKKDFIFKWNMLNNPGKMERTEIRKKIQSCSDENFERFMNMRISSLTLEKVDELQKEMVQIEKEVESLKETTPSKLYSSDLKLI